MKRHITILLSILVVSFGGRGFAEKDCRPCRVSLKPLDLTRAPTHDEIIDAGQLGGPLSPTGPTEKSTADDRLLFGQAIHAWNGHDYRRALTLFRRHIREYPQSPWTAEAELHLGCEARFNGRYAEAEAAFRKIVAEHGSDKGTYGGSFSGRGYPQKDSAQHRQDK